MALTAAASAPLGGVPPPADLGARFSQKREWFRCPLSQAGYSFYSFVCLLARSLAPLRGGNIPAVELQRGLQRNLCSDVTGVQRGGVFFFGFVERVDVCLVVL